MRILLIGDIHGRWQELNHHLTLIQSMFRIGGAIQVGDFGFFEENFARAEKLELFFSVPLHVLDGNHEDHSWLSWAMESGVTQRWRAHHNLFYHPRSSCFTLHDTKIGVLGGALHVDRPQQTSHDRLMANFVQAREVESAAHLFNQERPEVIITHTCPAGIGIGIASQGHFAQGIVEHVVNAGYTPGPVDDCGDMELNRLWQKLKYRPKVWAFGHFHRSHEAHIDGTQFICLPCLPPPHEQLLVLWDTDDKCLHQLRWPY